MSVALYISKATEGIQKKIKDNIEFAKANPYPKDELKSALESVGQDSALSKLYTLDGRTDYFISSSPEVIVAAKQQADFYPGLWNKLTKGHKGIANLKKNKDLEKIKPANELNSEFAKFINELNKSISLGSKIKIEEIFSDKTDNDAFEEYVYASSLSLNTYGADSLIRSAFTELFNKQQLVSNQKESKPSAVNDMPGSIEGKESPTASINSTIGGQGPSNSAISNPINPTSTKSSEPTSVTSLDGGVTSKVGELQTENILDTNPSQSVSINLESKQADSKPAVGSTSNLTTSSTTLNSTTVNDAKSASSVTSNPSNTSNNTGVTVNNVNSDSSVTSNPSNTSNNTDVTNNKNTLKVANTDNQSSSSTVNENTQKKEKGGFLSKVGNLAKKTGAVLNLPSIGELGEQAKGLFGATGANISSQVSKVKNSFSINSSTAESNSLPTSSNSTNSVNSSNDTSTENKQADILAGPTAGQMSNTSNLLKTETQTAMSVEQNKPVVTPTSTPAPVSSVVSPQSMTPAISNTSNSQNTSLPTTLNSTTSQNTQSTNQPSSTPAGVGVNVDMTQLTQSIMRLERILISGIDVTIKDT